MLNKILLFVFFAFGWSITHSQSVPVEKDTGLSRQKSLYDKYHKSGDFAYIDYLEKLLREQQVLMDTVRNAGKRQPGAAANREKKKSLFQKLFTFSGATVFYWILGICFMGIFLYYMLISSGLLTPMRKKHATLHSHEEDELKDADTYDDLIRKAEKNGDYAVAVRYWYLKSLKNLWDNGLIEYAQDKTNQEYVSELANTPLEQDFRNLTRYYEYIWYGTFPLKQPVYNTVSSSFEIFNSKTLHHS